MNQLGASVLCSLCLLGGLLLPRLCLPVHAQDKTPDEAVVAALVKIVNDKGQGLERRMKASDKLAELKVKDKEAVQAVAALLEELWPLKGDENQWVTSTIKDLTSGDERLEPARKLALEMIDRLTENLERVSKALAAISAAEFAEPTWRKALALEEAGVQINYQFKKDYGIDKVSLRTLKLKALENLVARRTPSAIAAITAAMDGEVRLEVIEALGKLKVMEVVPKLTDKLLKSKSKNERRASAVALGEIGSTKALPKLKAAEAVEEDKSCLTAISDAIKLIESGGK
jgi:HEAT repeat protein